jgi:uncharacterized protein (DUF433 family)
MNWRDLITIDPDVLVGKPVIAGTRLSVEFIIERLADGWTEQDLLDQYPGLTHEQVQSCLAYAAETLREQTVYPMPARG